MIHGQKNIKLCGSGFICLSGPNDYVLIILLSCIQGPTMSRKLESYSVLLFY